MRHADWSAPRRFIRAKRIDPAALRTGEYEGVYYCKTLRIHYTVTRSNGGLDILVAAGVQASQVLHTEPLLEDVFRARSEDREFADLFALGTVSVKFGRDREGRVTGMRISMDRVRNLEFEKVR